MERFTLAGLLAVLVPSLAFAQRVEIAVFGGAYRPAAIVREGRTGFICDAEPCPYYFRDVRAAGTTLGGRLTVSFTSTLGLDLTAHYSRTRVQRSQTEWPGAPALNQFSVDETMTVLAVQPRQRVELGDGVLAVFAIGPAVGSLSSNRDGGVTFGLAGSAALQIQVLTLLGIELRASGAHFVGQGLDGNRTHLTASAGLALAVLP